MRTDEQGSRQNTVEVQPHNSRNAIEVVTFALEFSQPHSGPVLQAVSSRHDSVRDILPRRDESRGTPLMFAFGSGLPLVPPIPPMMSGSSLTGVAFSQFKPTGELAWQAVAEGQFLSVNCFDYGRWSQVWQIAHDILLKLSQPILSVPSQQVIGFGMQCVDKFRVSGPAHLIGPSTVFSLESEFLPPRLRANRNTPWHCHQAFVDDSDLVSCFEMHHINVDVSSDGSTQAVQIVGLHRILATRDEMGAVIGQIPANLDEGGAIWTSMERLHQRNKSVVSSLLNEEVRLKINLTV